MPSLVLRLRVLMSAGSYVTGLRTAIGRQSRSRESVVIFPYPEGTVTCPDSTGANSSDCRGRRRTVQKVALLAESEGTLITRYYLTTMPHPHIDKLVMVSPVLRAGRIYYPPRQENTGWGIEAGGDDRISLGAGSSAKSAFDARRGRSHPHLPPIGRSLAPLDHVDYRTFKAPPALRGSNRPSRGVAARWRSGRGGRATRRRAWRSRVQCSIRL
jgi:hypothetical protein